MIVFLLLTDVAGLVATVLNYRTRKDTTDTSKVVLRFFGAIFVLHEPEDDVNEHSAIHRADGVSARAETARGSRLDLGDQTRWLARGGVLREHGKISVSDAGH